MWDDNSFLSGSNVIIDSSSNIVVINGLNNYVTSESIEDDAYIDIQSATSGFGFVLAGNNEEYCNFVFATTGAVLFLLSSTNATNADTDGKLCIFDNGTNVRIKNRLGSAKVLKVNIYYS